MHRLRIGLATVTALAVIGGGSAVIANAASGGSQSGSSQSGSSSSGAATTTTPTAPSQSQGRSSTDCPTR